jgi:hypothetical protein
MDCRKNHSADWTIKFNIRAGLCASSSKVLAEVLYNIGFIIIIITGKLQKVRFPYKKKDVT